MINHAATLFALNFAKHNADKGFANTRKELNKLLTDNAFFNNAAQHDPCNYQQRLRSARLTSPLCADTFVTKIIPEIKLKEESEKFANSRAL
jgi:hypothetical protein